MPEDADGLIRKVIQADSTAATPWLQQVHEALDQSRPAGIAPITSMRSLGGEVHIERPRIHGRTLGEVLEDGHMPVQRCIAIAYATAAGLRSLHARGVQHGNLKPSNIVIDGDDVTLVDFGLASLRDPLDLPVLTAGRYLSPEQAGLIDFETGEWSDLYALGTILYECLAGHAPFVADSLGGVLRQHLNDRPASLRDAGIEIPGALEDLVLRLLRKDPRERYQTAAGLMRDLAAIRDGQPVVIGAEDHRDHLTDPAFLGRSGDLDALGTALARVREGRPALCFVEAESGAGKTRLLQEFAHRARLQGAWIIYGQGRDHAAPRPFGMLDGVAHALDMLRAVEPARYAAILDACAEDAASLCQALPSLAQHFPDASATDDPDEHGQARTIGALTRLLDALGSPAQPAVLLLDDLQWADAPTRRLLIHWWQRRAAGHVVIVGAFRQEEVAEDDPLRALETDDWIRLAPFGRDDVADLVRSMAGPVDDGAIDFVARMADGNPFMASAVLRGLVESHDLESGDKGWSLRQGARLDAGDAGMLEFLLARMKQLPEDTGRLLAVAAVLGKEFQAETAARLAGLSADAALINLHSARSRHILIHTDRQGTFAFTHDKLREAVLAGPAPQERTDLHRRAARHFQADEHELIYELAYHFDAAGDPRAALPYALAAADQARHRFALDVAEGYYAMAQRGMTGTDDPTRFRILSGMGETLMLRGDYQGAAPWFEQARTHAADAVERAQLSGRIGDLWFKQGDLQRASRAIVAGLRELGQPAPTTKAGHLLRLPKEVLVQAWHSMRPGRIGHREGTARQATDLLAADLYSSLAHINWFLRGPACTAWAHLREMNIAERYAPSAQSAMAYAEHAVVMTTVPWHTRGTTYGRRALETRIDLDQAWGQGQARHFYALGLLAQGRLGDALEHVEEAARIFERTGDLWQANNAGWNVAYILARQGDLDAAQRVSQACFERADRIGDLQNTGLALWTWALAGGKDLSWERIEAEIARCPSMDAQTGEAIHQCAGLWRLAHDDAEGALASFQEAWRIARKASLRSEYVVGIPVWIATAAREAAEQRPAWDETGRRRLRRIARRALRRAMVETVGFPTHRPQAWRERAHVLAAAGDMAGAKAALLRAIEGADRSGLAVEAWQARRLYEAMGQGRGWPTVPASALPLPRFAGARAGSLSIVDRFQSLIDAGRDIAGAVKEGEVLRRLERAAAETLRGDEVHVTSLQDDDARLQPVVELAAAAQAPTPIVEESLLHALGVRSGLAVPVFVRGDVTHVITVLHHELEDLYGDQEVAVGKFLSALAGVALENAAGYVALEVSRDHERLQTSLLKSQAEAMIEAAIVMDDGGRLLTWNGRFCSMWRMPPEALKDAQESDVTDALAGQLEDPSDWQRFVAQQQDAADASGAVQLRLRDGRIVDCYSSPVADEEARYGRAWYFRDVTRELRDQESLLEAYDRLRDVDRMKTAFLNTAAHELHTPLTPIAIQLSMLRPALEGRLDEREQRSFDVLTRNIDRLRNLVEEILDTVKLAGNRLRISAQDAAVSAMIHEVGLSFEATARTRRITLVQDVPDDLHAWVDAPRLHQVLFNLLSNAMRFCAPGGRVYLRAWQDQRKLCIQVSDDGPGITAEQASVLFEPFSQPVPSPAGQAMGTGLGLHVCQGIVQEHKGSLQVSADGPGKGATFTVQLPRQADGI